MFVVNGESYTRFMAELDAIADKIKAFPECLHESVYSDWRRLLLDKDLAQASTYEVVESQKEVALTTSVAKKAEDEVRNYASEITAFYESYKLSECNDMELSAFVAYYFTAIAHRRTRWRRSMRATW